MNTTAQYSSIDVPERYRGNPLIEALPGVQSSESRLRSMIQRPQIDLTRSRQQPVHMRAYDVDVLDELFLPPPVMSEFANSVDRLIRQSYSKRNPFCRDEAKRLHNVKGVFDRGVPSGTTTGGMLFVSGVSGVGKSRLCRSVLSAMPQSIRHTEYKGQPLNCTQVVWISVDAPIGDSVKGLLLRMLEELDKATGMSGMPGALATSHLRSSVDALVFVFGQAAMTHRLGLLHIDDLQRVAESSEGKRRALQLVIQLANVVRCPVIFSGTPSAMTMLETSFEAARRVTSGGAFMLDLPKSASDRFFVQLTKMVLTYQWLDNPLDVTDKVRERLFEMSCGITSVVLFLCKHAQIHALEQGHDSLTLKHFEDVYAARLKPLHKALRALRKPSPKAIAEYEDAVKKMNHIGSVASGGCSIDAGAQ
jgi:hypothetical protein